MAVHRFDSEDRFAMGEKGAGQARANVKGSACKSTSAARQEDRPPEEGVLVQAELSSLTGRRHHRDLTRRAVRLAARCGGERQERWPS